MILEEAAYCDEGETHTHTHTHTHKNLISNTGFFYETVAPILSVGNSSLVAISTLTSEINL